MLIWMRLATIEDHWSTIMLERSPKRAPMMPRAAIILVPVSKEPQQQQVFRRKHIFIMDGQPKITEWDFQTFFQKFCPLAQELNKCLNWRFFRFILHLFIIVYVNHFYFCLSAHSRNCHSFGRTFRQFNFWLTYLINSLVWFLCDGELSNGSNTRHGNSQ